MGGRHPGHYFMDKDDFNDIVTRTEVCPVQIKVGQIILDKKTSKGGHISEWSNARLSANI